MRLLSNPALAGLRGQVQIPGDKSISHRAAMLAAFAHGQSRISGWLQAEDTLATLRACEQLGANISWSGDEQQPIVLITGCAGRFRQPARGLDLGNAGTGVRLLLGLLAGQSLQVELTGDESLRQRPMGRILTPLLQMGAQFSKAGRPVSEHELHAGQPCLLPLHSQGPVNAQTDTSPGLQAIDYQLPMASAQVQAAVLLAGLQARGVTTVIQPGECRDHSERMLQHFGAQILRLDQAKLQIQSGPLHAADVIVPADISSASFLLAAATLVPNSEISLPSIGVNPTRNGILRVMQLMGARVIQGPVSAAAEPCADLQAGSASLHGIDIPPDWVANCIDEFPIIMAMAALATGITRIRGAAELRVKESDRLAVMSAALQTLGVRVEEYEDGVDVYGLGGSGAQLRAASVNAAGDHRIAMSLAVLGLRAAGPLCIQHAEAIATSYPQFCAQMNELGATLQWQ
ncbi:MAG: 3-phosphoshikimate 1-carboxyvinyltransferase [Gammaproteobacteria bacterium]|nr:3-phosphoshikimate 1-carboxyvinyltransferase [Gammaproteobacteria bacterium]